MVQHKRTLMFSFTTPVYFWGCLEQSSSVVYKDKMNKG